MLFQTHPSLLMKSPGGKSSTSPHSCTRILEFPAQMALRTRLVFAQEPLPPPRRLGTKVEWERSPPHPTAVWAELARASVGGGGGGKRCWHAWAPVSSLIRQNLHGRRKRARLWLLFVHVPVSSRLSSLLSICRDASLHLLPTTYDFQVFWTFFKTSVTFYTMLSEIFLPFEHLIKFY